MSIKDKGENDQTEFVNQCIAKFINQIRLAGGRTEAGEGPQKEVHRRLDFGHSSREHDSTDRMSEEEINRRQAKDRIVEAEKYKASIELPRGNCNSQIIDTDDEFLHLTCHVEQNLVDKVEAKNFVELDPFVPKLDGLAGYREVNKLDIIHKGGETYWAPHVDKKQKITNIHMWDQAFRVYMAIYTRRYPMEAAEMAQYVHTIHHAANKYTWENVAYYDFIFRKNMAKNPTRSWGKTFGHMWNIALTDPIKPNTSNHFQRNQTNGGGGSFKKPCWKFNKGSCSYGINCRFQHRCTQCGGTSHGANSCFRKNNANRNEKSQGKKEAGATSTTGKPAENATETQ